MAPTLVSFLPILVVFVIWYFLLIRPQQRRAQELKQMQAGLSKGDKVVTQAGILGRVVRVQDDTTTLDVGGNVQIEFQRSAIVGLAGDRSDKGEKGGKKV
ncbi:MAG: preprotein translocase subunit YajC [Candidatus Eiseniibacteriota bacterium]